MVGCLGVAPLLMSLSRLASARDFSMSKKKNKTHYIVQDAAEKMPASCWGKYRRIAVLEVDADREHVSMISPRARGCHSIVATWEKLHVGTTDRCAYSRALVEATDLADRLNRERS